MSMLQDEENSIGIRFVAQDEKTQQAGNKTNQPAGEAPKANDGTLKRVTSGGPTGGELVRVTSGAGGSAVREVSRKSLVQYGLGEEPWHLMDEKEALGYLKTSLSGLSETDAAERLKKYGLNAITPPPTTPFILKVIFCLLGGFQLMMWFGATLCFIVFGLSKGEDFQTLVLAIVLILVVLVTTSFQMFQEGKSDKVMAALKALSPSQVYVYRGGDLKLLPAVQLVPGDIVKVTGGEKVPADVKVLSSADLKVNNASLTGENVDIKLGVEANHEQLYEAKNIARSGCNFTNGTGVGMVFATGDATFFGCIAKSTVQIHRPDTLMKKEIHRLIKVMAAFAFSLGITFFILAILNGYSVTEAVIFMIGIVVANVPEGLLPQMTVALTLTAKRMLVKNVLVSNLEIIETLGAVNVICSDKTGTLTCNRMTVTHLVHSKRIYKTPISGVLEGDTFSDFDATDANFKALQRISTLNSEAVFLPSSANEPDILKKETKGDASEAAIIKFFEPIRPIEEYRSKCKRLAAIPFNSSNKWMMSVSEQEGSDPNKLPLLVLVKGAPERVMNMCTSVLSSSGPLPMDASNRAEMEQINFELASRGERVLAFAHLELPRDKYPPGFVVDVDSNPPNVPLSGLTLVGFLGLSDPPRMTVKPAIDLCNQAGIKVYMVTGDHPVTAEAIAKSIGLLTQPSRQQMERDKQVIPETYRGAIVVHGTEMLTFQQSDWDFVLEHKEIVFARTMPQQKQDIVVQLNKLGKIVAMTGDGVNDAPALKASNVGIAMGTGSAVAKEAAQMILLTDDFGAIVDGIREGRLIFDNLKKCVTYVLSSNVPEIVPFLLFIAMKIPLGIETISILVIDLGTDLAPAVALAYEEPEDAIMQMPPRKPSAHLVGFQMMLIAYFTVGAIQTFAAYWAFYWVFADYGFTFHGLLGSAEGWKKKYGDLHEERKEFFHELCKDNTKYMALGRNCEAAWRDYRIEALQYAQGAFLVTVVWTQMANILVRKTMVASIFDRKLWRLTHNRAMFWAVLSEIVVILIIYYPAGVGFDMRGDSVYAVTALWVIPIIFAVEEARKFLMRWSPTKKWARKLLLF